MTDILPQVRAAIEGDAEGADEPGGAPTWLPCPSCGARTKVYDSRHPPTTGITRRRRQCRSCGEKCTTYEVTVPQQRQMRDDFGAFVADALHLSSDDRRILARIAAALRAAAADEHGRAPDA